MLRQLGSYYYKDPTLLLLVRVAQGLVHLGKGLLTLAPAHADNQLLSGGAWLRAGGCGLVWGSQGCAWQVGSGMVLLEQTTSSCPVGPVQMHGLHLEQACMHLADGVSGVSLLMQTTRFFRWRLSGWLF